MRSRARAWRIAANGAGRAYFTSLSAASGSSFGDGFVTAVDFCHGTIDLLAGACGGGPGHAEPKLTFLGCASPGQTLFATLYDETLPGTGFLAFASGSGPTPLTPACSLHTACRDPH